MLCPVCHTQNRDNAKFCKGCGLSFTPEMLEANQAANQSDQSAPTPQPTPAPSQPPQPVSADVEARQADAASNTPGVAPTNGQPASPVAQSYTLPDDLTLAPTQILSPQQMVAMQARRWQQELDREQLEQHSGIQPDMDIADTPKLKERE